jgi:uncharacterized protein YbaR (Trm112 family)
MHLLVTDRLSCPRCGPEFGLVLLAEKLEDRRVLEGALGCANCRERYPVTGGFSDFRPPPRHEPEVEGAGEPWSHPAASSPDPSDRSDPEEGMRLGAMLGVTEGPGLILLTGASVTQASRLAAMIEDIEIVALHPALRGRSEESGVSRILAGPKLPFFTGSLRGVVLEGRAQGEGLDEAVRVLSPGSRLVVRRPTEGLLDRLETAGLEVLLQTEKVMVATR